MRRFYAFLVMATFCVSPVAAQEWHVDLGADVGKTYSLVDGAFVPSTVPSVTLLFGPLTLDTSTYLYGGRFFEQDSSLSWYQRESDTRRWSLFGKLAHYKWPSGQDFNGQVGLRWRLR
jgi:hypothetical protein